MSKRGRDDAITTTDYTGTQGHLLLELVLLCGRLNLVEICKCVLVSKRMRAYIMTSLLVPINIFVQYTIRIDWRIIKTPRTFTQKTYHLPSKLLLQHSFQLPNTVGFFSVDIEPGEGIVDSFSITGIDKRNGDILFFTYDCADVVTEFEGFTHEDSYALCLQRVRKTHTSVTIELCACLNTDDPWNCTNCKKRQPGARVEPEWMCYDCTKSHNNRLEQVVII